MQIAIRTDASFRIGLGHLARCRTLARNLLEEGCSIHFVCRALPGNQIDLLRAEGYRVSVLPAPPKQRAADADYSAWLGVSQAQDAMETQDALACGRETITGTKSQQFDVLIVDHYALDSIWEAHLRPVVGRIFVIDDLANRQHECDLLLDQNFATRREARYANLLPRSAHRLLGPKFALLQPEYAHARQRLRRFSSGSAGGRAFKNAENQNLSANREAKSMEVAPQPVSRVLVFFGGTDPDNLTGRVLLALSDPAFASLRADVVVGANNPHRSFLEAQARARGNTVLHRPRPHLADLMAAADLAIGAGGITTWERCCLGLPSLVVSIADNQRSACEALAADNRIIYLGHFNAVTHKQITKALNELLNDRHRQCQLAAAAAELVDGQGTDRVTDMLLRGGELRCLGKSFIAG